MAEENVQNSKETAESQKSEETVEVKENTSEQTTEQEETITIPRKKWIASQQEGIRLSKKLKEFEEKQPEEVETETGGKTLDEIVDQKVQERVAPLVVKQEEEKVDKFFKKNPEAMDYLKDIEDNYQKMPGRSTETKLENAFLLAKKDAAKDAGKKEFAFNLYQKEQAVSSGGGESSTLGESLPSLTEEERKVAQALGIKEEAYAKRKTVK